MRTAAAAALREPPRDTREVRVAIRLDADRHRGLVTRISSARSCPPSSESIAPRLDRIAATSSERDIGQRDRTRPDPHPPDRCARAPRRLR